jgi:hypothetical protein
MIVLVRCKPSKEEDVPGCCLSGRHDDSGRSNSWNLSPPTRRKIELKR